MANNEKQNNDTKLFGIWQSAKRPIAVVAFGVLLYELIENLEKVTTAVGSFFSLLTPVFWGIAIAFLANMPLRFLEEKVFAKWNKKRLKLKRGLCTAVAILLMLALIALMGLLIIPKSAQSLVALAQGFDGYLAGFSAWAERLFNNGIFDKLGIGAQAESFLTSFWAQLMDPVGEILSGTAQRILRFTFSVVSFAINLLLALVLSVYALYNKERLISQLKKLVVAIFNHKTAASMLDICARANKTLNRYFFGMVIECFILGVMTFVAMSIFSFPYAIMISAVVGVTQLVPIIGPWVGGAAGALIILVTDPPMALWFILLLLIVQQLEANLVYPRVVGGAVGLEGIWALIAVILGGGLFGIAGVVFSVPVMAILYTLISEWANRRIEEKRSSGDLLKNSESSPKNTEKRSK